MDINLLVILLIVFVTMSSSVILLKFWMDFNLEVFKENRERKKAFQNKVNSKVRKPSFFNSVNFKTDNKKKNRDIIIDCEVEVLERGHEIDEQNKRLIHNSQLKTSN